MSYGQESMGVKHDNFLPTINSRLNPSALAAQKPWIHIHLVGFEAYARNNFVYIPDSKVSQLNADIVEGYNYEPNKYSAYANADVYGPMVSAAFGVHSVGIHTAIRSFGSAKNIPNNIKYLVDNNLPVNSQTLDVKKVRAEATAWGEIGLTYATIYEQEGNTMITAGATLKRLLGYFNGGLYIGNAIAEVNNDQINLYDLNGAYSFTEPATNAGRGWGTDLGITYFKLKTEMGRYIPHSSKGGCIDHNYEYKVGLSIIDLGYINFKNSAEKGSFDETMTEEQLEEISDQESDVLTAEAEDSFKAMLPGAISAQFDYNFNDKVFFNGTIIQKLNVPRLVGSERDNLLSASLRYEKRWFGLALPVTLQNYRHPQIGLSLRAGPFYLGSDHIVPFVKRSDIYAIDAYFGVQFALMKHPSCKKKGKNKKSTYTGGGDTMPPCPKW